MRNSLYFAAFQQAATPLVERLDLLRNIGLAMHDDGGE